MKCNFLTLIIVLLVAASTLGAQPAQATPDYYLIPTLLPFTECVARGYSTPLNLSYNVPDADQWTWSRSYTFNGHQTRFETGTGIYGGTGEDVIKVSDSLDLNTVTLPFSGTMRFEATFKEGRIIHTYHTYYYLVTTSCWPNLPGYVPPAYGTVVFEYGWVTGLGQNAASTGPAVPAGFVLKTITCDVAVFNTPGGLPVDDNRLKAGQNWFVNPTPTQDEKGKSWTEVFVGGYSNGFVPTNCVSGQ